MAQPPNPTATLLITCQDQPGLVAEVAHFIRKNGGNILHADQHHDHEQGIFFQRVEFETANFALPEREIPQAFEATAGAFGMDFAFRFSRDRPRVALLASKQPHCLYDLLSRFRHGDLRADVRLVVSNHPDHADVAAFFGIPFHHLPVTADTKEAQERALLSVLRQEDINLVVLARYMQILSEGFVDAFPHQIINIHHSFLPAFVGARPYHQAHARGVKVIGVTAHYVTKDLDQGPIIEQDVERVTHRDTPQDLVARGRDLEKVVLARAVRFHLENRIVVYDNKTVVLR